MKDDAETVEQVQELPATSSDERMHVLDRDCWCEPTVEIVEGRQRVRHAKQEAHA